MPIEFVILTAIGLGVGLAMDAFSVSLANGLNEPKMKLPRVTLIAGIFAIFQGLMPMIGWGLIKAIEYLLIAVEWLISCIDVEGIEVILSWIDFGYIEAIIPWIAFGLLGYIGGKMIFDAFKCKCCEDENCGRLTFGLLMVQGIATSIDAMSGGVTMAAENYMFSDVAISVAIIAAMTFAICVAGIYLGKVFGTKLANKASIFGGSILIIIGIIILVKSFMGA